MKKLTADLKAYMSKYNSERRAACKAAGLCVECGAENARPGLTRCQGCADAQQARRVYLKERSYALTVGPFFW